MTTVLIVDDSATNRALLSRILEQHDYRILEAANGAEGLGMARLRRPDVVITDVLMPKVDGYELERELRLDPQTASIPVVIHTAAYDSREVGAMVGESPRVRVLPKPSEVSQVLDTVASLAASTVAGTETVDDHERTDHLTALNERLLRSVRELEAAERDRQQLLEHLIRAQEDERVAIAGDIHDDSVQAMTAVAMRLELLGDGLTDPDMIERHRVLQETVRSAIARLRRLLFRLHPPALEREGLAAAVQSYLDHADGTGAPPDVVIVDDDLAFEPPVSLRTVLYRVVQESLVNTTKHADAQRVRVELSTTEGGVAVAVQDDGRGFAVDDVVGRPGHMGLSSMRQRVELAGGRWRLDSAPGEGTTVHAWVPTPSETASP